MTAAEIGALIPGVPLLFGLIGLALPAGDRGEVQSNRGPAATLGIAGAAAALAVTLGLLLFAAKPLDVSTRWVDLGGLQPEAAVSEQHDDLPVPWPGIQVLDLKRFR